MSNRRRGKYIRAGGVIISPDQNIRIGTSGSEHPDVGIRIGAFSQTVR